jgi:quercetin dioxygenase-like cupin family protein
MVASLRSATAPVLIRSGDAERLGFPDGSTMTLLADSDATGGVVSIHRSVLAAGADGANPHHHTAGTEVIYVVGGQIKVLIGDEIVEASEGDLAVVPPGVVHAFAAVPEVGAELLIASTSGIERFSLWRRIQRVVTGSEPAGDLVADQANAYDTYSDDRPQWDRGHHPKQTNQHARGDQT